MGRPDRLLSRDHGSVEDKVPPDPLACRYGMFPFKVTSMYNIAVILLTNFNLVLGGKSLWDVETIHHMC